MTAQRVALLQLFVRLVLRSHYCAGGCYRFALLSRSGSTKHIPYR